VQDCWAKANHQSIGERVKSQLQELQTVNAEFQAFMESVQQPRGSSLIYPDFPTPPTDPASPDHRHWNVSVGIGDIMRRQCGDGLDDAFLPEIANRDPASLPPPPTPHMMLPSDPVSLELPLLFQQPFPNPQQQTSQTQQSLRADRQQEALKLAVANGHIPMVRLLIEHGTDVNSRDRDGRTVLLCAVEADDAEMVELLLESHADSNNVDELGRSALHIAASVGHVRVAKILLRHENSNVD
jgi:hypothetical protein